jgi:anti-sigma regulatory factor (Ser/Thr protein kinase)
MKREIAIKLETTADILLLRPLNLFLRGLLKQHPALTDSAEWIDNLELVFNEAFANIHDHAYRGQEPGPLTVVVRLDAGCLEIRFEDRGTRFEPDQVRPPNLHKPGERGLGVWLIRQIIDEMTYRSEPDGRNILSLVKYLPPRKGNTPLA